MDKKPNSNLSNLSGLIFLRNISSVVFVAMEVLLILIVNIKLTKIIELKHFGIWLGVSIFFLVASLISIIISVSEITNIRCKLEKEGE